MFLVLGSIYTHVKSVVHLSLACSRTRIYLSGNVKNSFGIPYLMEVSELILSLYTQLV